MHLSSEEMLCQKPLLLRSTFIISRLAAWQSSSIVFVTVSTRVPEIGISRHALWAARVVSIAKKSEVKVANLAEVPGRTDSCPAIAFYFRVLRDLQEFLDQVPRR